MAAPARLDRLERVTDLVLVLLNTEQPLTLDAIAIHVPGYPEEHSARRQAFERDKRLLRDEGIPVLTQRLDGLEQYGYQIDRDAFYLPDLALEPDEQVALHLAVAGVHLDDPSGRDALLKLGATGLGEVRPIATLVTPRALIDLFEAVRTQTVASFSYRNGMRRVAPAGLWFRFGHWYLVAWDLDRAAVRTFRVDRIEEAVHLETPGGAVLPEGIDIKASLPDEPWRAEGDDHVVTRIRVDRHRRAESGRGGGGRPGREPRRRRLGRRLPCAWRGFPSSAPGSSVCSITPRSSIRREFRSELTAWLHRHRRRRRRAQVDPGRSVPFRSRPPRSEEPRGRPAGTRAGRPANVCGVCWPWSDGWPGWGRRPSRTWRAASPWMRTS